MNLSRKESHGQAERRAHTTVGRGLGEDEELVVGGLFSGIPSAPLSLYPLLYCGRWDVRHRNLETVGGHPIHGFNEKVRSLNGVI